MTTISKAQVEQTKTASESLGNFFGELFGHIGHLGSIPVTAIYTKAKAKLEEKAENNKNIREFLTFVKENHQGIAKGFFAVACFINFWYSPLIFTLGLVIGFVASTSYSLITFKSLQEGELLGHTKERNYASQIALTILATLNLYLGNTILDNAFFGISCGLIAGNNLFHMFKDTDNYKKLEKMIVEGLKKKATESEDQNSSASVSSNS